MLVLCTGAFGESLQLNFAGPPALSYTGTDSGIISLELPLDKIERNPVTAPNLSQDCILCKFDAPSLAAIYSAGFWAVSSGNFSVTGTVANPVGGSFTGTLLTGTLSGFKFGIMESFLMFEPITLTVSADPYGIFAAFDLPNLFPYKGILNLPLIQASDVTFNNSGDSIGIQTSGITSSVALDANAPEPLSLTLVAAGLAGLLLLRPALTTSRPPA
jgi:hypothetical protein